MKQFLKAKKSLTLNFNQFVETIKVQFKCLLTSFIVYFSFEVFSLESV